MTSQQRILFLSLMVFTVVGGSVFFFYSDKPSDLEINPFSLSAEVEYADLISVGYTKRGDQRFFRQFDVSLEDRMKTSMSDTFVWPMLILSVGDTSSQYFVGSTDELIFHNLIISFQTNEDYLSGLENAMNNEMDLEFVGTVCPSEGETIETIFQASDHRLVRMFPDSANQRLLFNRKLM